MTAPTNRLRMPVALVVVITGCGTPAPTPSDASTDATHGDVITLESGLVCDPPQVIPDAGTSCGTCYGPNFSPSDCALCPVGPDGGLIPLC